MKTQCPHCKAVYKIPDAYRDKQINCPKCKEAFTARKYEGTNKAQKVEYCENCGRIIGNLEQAYVYHNQIVCKQCYSKLTSEKVSSATNNSKNEKMFVQQEQKSTSQVSTTRQNEIITNVKQGALLGGCVCFLLGLILMFVSLWSFILYIPFFLTAFILSIVAMAQARVAGGVFLLIGTIIIPPILFFFMVSAGVSKKFDEARPYSSTQLSTLESHAQETDELTDSSLTATTIEQTPKIEKEVQAPSIPVIGLGGSVVIDEIKISVQRARLGFIERKSIFGDSVIRSDSKYLLIDLTLENTSTGKIIYIQNTWEKSKLTDNYGNIEGPQFGKGYSIDEDIVGFISSAKMKPGEILKDMMIFDLPVESAIDFTVEADPGFWKSVSEGRIMQLSDSSFRMRFTRNQIQTN